MNDVIYEAIVSTRDAQGIVNIAPMGVRYRGAPAQVGTPVVLMPFRPSTTLDNLLGTRAAVVNLVTDTRVFAGAITRRRRDWPVVAAACIDGVRLAQAQRHLELQVRDVRDDGQRPVVTLDCVHAEDHAPFAGFNRAQAAVLEAAVLASRLGMLDDAKVDFEMAYLQIAIDKTAGPDEREAWTWLREMIDAHRAARAAGPAGGAVREGDGGAAGRAGASS